MAIKISTDGTVRVIRPTDDYFTIGEVHEQIGPDIDMLEFDHVMFLFNINKNKKNHNSLASLVFGETIYGDALVVAYSQLPDELYVEDPNPADYNIADIDNGVILTIQKVIKEVRLIASGGHIDREELLYDPTDTTLMQDNIPGFFGSVYEYIANNQSEFKQQNIIFSDHNIIIKVEEPDRKVIVNKMIQLFIEQEEFEKCNFLKKTFID